MRLGLWVIANGSRAPCPYGSSVDSQRRDRASATKRWAIHQALDDLTGPFYPILRRLFPRYVTTTVNIRRAMIHVAATRCSKQILSSGDINQLSG